jgi:hypothetical protein
MASNFSNPTQITSANSGNSINTTTLPGEQVYEIGQPVFVKSPSNSLQLSKPLWVHKRSAPNMRYGHRGWSYNLVDIEGVSNGKWIPGPQLTPDTTRAWHTFDARGNGKDLSSNKPIQEVSSNGNRHDPSPTQGQNNGGLLASSTTHRFKVGDLVLVINETPPFVKPIPMVVLETRYSNEEWRYQVQSRVGQGGRYEIHEGNIELDTNATL